MHGCKSASSDGAPTVPEWERLLASFRIASESQLRERELRHRVDSKFVMPATCAAALLPRLVDAYSLVLAAGRPVATYRTLYFDTMDLAFFHAHRRQRRVRHKVRIRHYPDRSKSYLDVKTRVSDSWTTKSRLEHEYGDTQLRAEDLDLVRSCTGLQDVLLPQAWTNFHRVMWVGDSTFERVTLDLELSMENGDRVRPAFGAAIFEVKQVGFQRRTPVMNALRSAGWRASAMSKYCTAISWLRPDVSHSGLRTRLRAIERVCA